MSIIQGTGRGGARGFYDFPIEQSLRFDGSSYLSRTFDSGGSTTTWTFSTWCKQSALAVTGQLFSGGGDVSDQIFFGDTDIFRMYLSNAYRIETTQVFRDTSAWNHFVISIDTTNSFVRLYQNGIQVAVVSYTGNTKLNAAVTHYIGRYAATDVEHFNGYLANIQFIDGQALDASYFGETKQDIWIPKTFDGTSSTGGSTVSTDYGTNGFLLDFSSISGTTINDTAPIDTNHSSANNWTATGF